MMGYKAIIDGSYTQGGEQLVRPARVPVMPFAFFHILGGPKSSIPQTARKLMCAEGTEVD
jgi:hypothetical protein